MKTAKMFTAAAILTLCCMGMSQRADAARFTAEDEASTKVSFGRYPAPTKRVEKYPVTRYGHIVYKERTVIEPSPAVVWYITKVDGDKVLLISEKLIDRHNFNSTSDNSWETSDLRAWLNGEFAKAAFTEEERKYIIETTLDNRTLGNPDAAPTQDKVFCLSLKEVQKYMPAEEERRAKATIYTLEEFRKFDKQRKRAEGFTDTVKISLQSTDYFSWLLRTPESEGQNILFVTKTGEIDKSGIPADKTIIAISKNTVEGIFIRPAMWVKMNPLLKRVYD